ncbi:YwmB family TATA-box binding protein [Ornithinibacillus salinisoli]|uniref:YwmB family TATA-box binding protein n=1 Tax=Ornithinibacillus salinisoli TaxID=1848459 RepID=A0ABW4VXR3_9BACI
MKKTVLISIFILLISNNVMAQETYTDELIDMATIVQKSDLDIDSWQVILKEKMDKPSVEKVIQELKNSYLFTRTEDENSIKYSFRDAHNSGEVIERYSAVIPKNPLYQAEIIAVLEGDSWNNTSEADYKEKVNALQRQYFTKYVQIFACLTTSDDAIIKSDYFLSKFDEELDLQHIRKQDDTVLKDRKIIYGYTSQWKNKMTIVDKPVNIQIVVEKTDEDNEKYTIGTPILINEY